MKLPTIKQPLFSARVAYAVLLICCAINFVGVLIAGLSPFTSRPRNEVNWLQDGSGLQFGEYATIMTSNPLRWDGPDDGPCSIELWMQPGLIQDSNTMLAFDSPRSAIRFTLRQSLDDLALEWKSTDQKQQNNKSLYIPHALHHSTPLLITMTSGPRGVSVYLDGVLARSSPALRFTRQELSGKMVVGSSPWADDSWSGVLKGIGLYASELTREQVQQNYADWTISDQPETLSAKQATAIFKFSETNGTVIHNQVPGSVDLEIPDHYLVLHPPFLEKFWRTSDWSSGFWKDVLVNIFGFVPFGFFFCVYFSRSMPVKRAILLTIAVGCALSFFIETTQYFLPTRDSDSRDWLDNTLGTMLGAIICVPLFVQKLLACAGIAFTEGSDQQSSSSSNAVLEGF